MARSEDGKNFPWFREFPPNRESNPIIFLKSDIGHGDCSISFHGRTGCWSVSGRGNSVATGMWTAVSGAIAQQHAIDAVANNLANVDTPAFKKEAAVFQEYLARNHGDVATVDIPRKPIQDKDFYPLDGRDKSYVVTDGTRIDYQQGPLLPTQSALDVALDGPGFLEVSTPSGVRYTRHGSLKLAMDGRLVTSEGYPVLAAQPGGLAAAQSAASTVQPGQGGPSTQGGVAAGQGAAPEIAARFITVPPDAGRLTITEAGDIYIGQDPAGKLAVVRFEDAKPLRKVGQGLFENPGGKATATAANGTRVLQGMIEKSNVNPIEEMNQMIRANRLFEQDMKAIRTWSDLMGREANDLGKL